jgi:ferredoxin
MSKKRLIIVDGVIGIDRAARRIQVRETETRREYEEAHDALVLAMRANGVTLHLNDPTVAFEPPSEQERQNDGMVGCTTCANICPTQANSFSDWQLVQKIEREQLEVPTLKGALEMTPSHMTFEVASTEQQDSKGFLNEVRSLIRENQFVVANENWV